MKPWRRAGHSVLVWRGLQLRHFFPSKIIKIELQHIQHVYHDHDKINTQNIKLLDYSTGYRLKCMNLKAQYQRTQKPKYSD